MVLNAIPCIPKSTKARLALAGALTMAYILISTFYMGYGSSAFPVLELKPDDLGHTEHKPIPTESLENIFRNSTNSTTPVASRILLVSAFFPLNTSKTTPAEYDALLTNFLGTVETEIYMYTPPEEAERLLAQRSPNVANLYLDTNFTSMFEIPALKDMEDVYTRNRVKDRSRPRHSIESYAVINSKPYFLHAAVTARAAQGATYDYAFFVDAKSFHSAHDYRTWPDPARVDALWVEGASQTDTAAKDLLFIPISGLPHSTMGMWNPFMGPVTARFTQGSLFGGPPEAIAWWAAAYYSHHKKFIAEETFIGTDQGIANALALEFPSRLLTVWPGDPEAPAALAVPTEGAGLLGQCGSEWFYHQFLLADDGARAAMRGRWIAAASGWRWWGWWRGRDTAPCRETRVLGMKEVLQRHFGKQWTPPQALVPVPPKVDWES